MPGPRRGDRKWSALYVFAASILLKIFAFNLEPDVCTKRAPTACAPNLSGALAHGSDRQMDVFQNRPLVDRVAVGNEKRRVRHHHCYHPLSLTSVKSGNAQTDDDPQSETAVA